jgi:parallel beta-helix repeat protein
MQSLLRVLTFYCCLLLSGSLHAATFTVSSLANAGAGTLRQAIIDANASVATPHTIVFTVAGTITLTTGLPIITRTVTIDGSTAPGWSTGSGPVVIVSGGGSPPCGSGIGADGLNIQAPDCGVFGLQIVGFGYNGIQVLGNANDGVQIGDPTRGNVIAYNGYYGIYIEDADNGTIIGNRIGIDWFGTQTNWGNCYSGVQLFGGWDNANGPMNWTIGSCVPGGGNIIFNSGYSSLGVEGSTSTNNTVRCNSMACNGTGGYPPFDHNDGNYGTGNGNHGFPAPVISYASSTTVTGTATANAIIDLYTDDGPCCAYCSGARWVGTTTADGAGNWTITVTNPLFCGDKVTATATSTGGVSIGGTSMFSNSCAISPTGISGSTRWTGAVSTEWNNASNWSCGIPTCALDAYIPTVFMCSTPRYPIIGTVNGTCKSLVIDPGAKLTINSGYQLDVCGNITNNGNLICQTNSTVRLIGSGNQTLTGGFTGANSFFNLIALQTGTFNVRIHNLVAVNGVLTLTNGIFQDAAGTGLYVNVLNNAVGAVTGHSNNSYLQCSLRRAVTVAVGNQYDFPVGSLLKGYQNARIQWTTAAGSATMQAFFEDIPNPVSQTICSYNFNTGLNNGRWDISVISGTTGQYTMTLFSQNYTNGGTQNALTKNSVIVAGINCGTEVFSSPAIVSRAGLTGFSQFAVGTTDVPLPVELQTFTAKPAANRSVELSWKTNQEVNMTGYEIERQLENGTGFQSLGSLIPAKGAYFNYNYIDKELKTGQRYVYRLKMLENDGRYSYSNLAEAVLRADNNPYLAAYPNPVSKTLTVQTDVAGISELTLTGSTGEVIYNRKIACEQGLCTFELDLSTIAAGNYQLTVRNANGEAAAQKIIKQ